MQKASSMHTDDAKCIISALRTYPPTPDAVRLPPPLPPTGAVFHLLPWMGTASSTRRRASPTPTPDPLLPHRASSTRYRTFSTPTGTVCQYLTGIVSHDLLLMDTVRSPPRRHASTSPLPEDMLCAPVAVDQGWATLLMARATIFLHSL